MKSTLKKAVLALDYLIPIADSCLPDDKISTLTLASFFDLRKELVDMANWKPFFVDTHRHVGVINSPQQWGKVKKLYADLSEVAVMRLKDPTDDVPVFGFKGEYLGMTLREYFKQQDMKL
jgi:hypothetical protein